jgi:hypothetical protein
MSTESSGRSGRAWALVVALLVGAVVVLGDSQPSPALTVNQARAELQDARDQLADARARVREIQAEIRDATAALGDLEADERALTEQLRTKRREARQLSVHAYITGGGAQQYQLLASAEESLDLLWRQTMLGQQSLTAQQAAEEYRALRNETAGDVEATVESLDRLDRRLEQAELDVTHGERAVALAEIALIGAIEAERRAAAARNFGPVSGDKWAQLRHCESGNDYTKDTGNGYYGAYQFDLPTWRSMGGSGLPSEAPPWEQDARARALYAARGPAPWPVCGRHLM